MLLFVLDQFHFWEENKSHMCDFWDWQSISSWSASDWLELNRKQKSLKEVLLILLRPSSNKGKWDSYHMSSLLFPCMSFITKAEKQSSNCRVQSKTPNLILISMLVRSLQKANAERKHPRSVYHCLRTWEGAGSSSNCSAWESERKHFQACQVLLTHISSPPWETGKNEYLREIQKSLSGQKALGVKSWKWA